MVLKKYKGKYLNNTYKRAQGKGLRKKGKREKDEKESKTVPGSDDDGDHAGDELRGRVCERGAKSGRSKRVRVRAGKRDDTGAEGE